MITRKDDADEALFRNLEGKLLYVTQVAAMNAARVAGHGDKEAADQASVNAMRKHLEMIEGVQTGCLVFSAAIWIVPVPDVLVLPEDFLILISSMTAVVNIHIHRFRISFFCDGSRGIRICIWLVQALLLESPSDNLTKNSPRLTLKIRCAEV